MAVNQDLASLLLLSLKPYALRPNDSSACDYQSGRGYTVSLYAGLEIGMLLNDASNIWLRQSSGTCLQLGPVLDLSVKGAVFILVAAEATASKNV